MAGSPRFVCVGVDFGITHLALVELWQEEGRFTLGAMRLVDTTQYTRQQLACGTSEHADRLMHFLQEQHADLLARADHLTFLQRSPPQGLHVPRRRAVVELVSASTLHAWVFGARHGQDGKGRKGTMEMHASALCGRLSGDPTRWDRETRHLPRRREVADALLVAYYALRHRAPDAVFKRGAVSPHFQGWPAGPKGERWRDALFREKR